MSFNLDNVEITDINSDGDNLEIITERETRRFSFSEIKDLEINEVYQEDNAGTFATIGSIVGLIAGDFTGAISGGFSGWVASKIFSKEKLFTITFTLFNNDLISFITKSGVKDYFYESIKQHFNDYLSENINKNLSHVKKWKKNFELNSENKNYISFYTSLY